MLVILVLVSLSSQRWSLVSEYRRNNLSNDGISILKNGALPRLDTKVNFIFENKRQEVPPFWPNRQFEEYKRMHNRQAIVLDGNIRQRKFAVVSYYCPRRAGNILHNLFNNIAWAIIHNRTILVTYEGHEHHKSGSSFEYCQQTLRIAEWIAMYDDFASMIAQPVPVALNQSIQQHTVVIFPQIPDVMMSKNVFRTQWRDEPDSGGGKYHRYVRSLGDEAVRRATKLYQFDVNYLFGTYKHKYPFWHGMLLLQMIQFLTISDERNVFSRNLFHCSDPIRRLPIAEASSGCRRFHIRASQSTHSDRGRWVLYHRRNQMSRRDPP